MYGAGGLAGVDVDADGDHEDGAEGEEDDGVDEHGDAVGLHAVELGPAAPPAAGDLADEPRQHHHEEGRRDQHRAPVARHGSDQR